MIQKITDEIFTLSPTPIGITPLVLSWENLFDTAWNETQFATETRLFYEPEPVNEIHFTPGTPFFLRGRISIQW